MGTDEEEQQFVTNIESTTHNTALYGSNTIDLDNTTSLNISARWNWASMKVDDQYGTDLEGHHFFWRINPGVGIVKELETQKFTLLIKESSRTPSIAELSCADPAQPCGVTKLFQADPPLHQVINRNLEVGASGNKAYNLFNMSHNIDWSVSAYAGKKL